MVYTELPEKSDFKFVVFLIDGGINQESLNVFWKLVWELSVEEVAPFSGILRGGGGVWGVQTPPQIRKALQNCAKLNSIVKTVKNCWI